MESTEETCSTHADEKAHSLLCFNTNDGDEVSAECTKPFLKLLASEENMPYVCDKILN